jgi:hypothetical protein
MRTLKAAAHLYFNGSNGDSTDAFVADQGPVKPGITCLTHP